MEEKLLYKIHKYGVYPGVARPFFARPSSTGQGRLKEEPLPVDLPRTARLDGKYSSERVTERVKARLVMGSYGESLGEARSVLDILKVFYDAIEGILSFVE